MAHRTALAAGLLALSVLWIGCQGPTTDRTQAPVADSPVDGDRLIIPIDSDPPSLDFVTCTDGWCLLVARFVADFLVDDGEHLETVPRLATSWAFSEGGRVLTFHLRPGVRWHDGAPFSARDVLFTYHRVMDPASGARTDMFQDIEEVSALDDLTVRVKYREPNILALDAWKRPLVPEHLLQSVAPGTKDPARRPIGTGPFRFARWERGREIVLEANRDYFLGRPHLDELVFKIIPSPSTQFQALLAGETDWTTIPPSEWAGTAAGAEFKRRFQVYEYPAQFLFYIAWNERNPLFGDPRVRRAMTLALDREGFVKKVYSGAGLVAASSFHPSQFGFDPAIQPLPHEPEKAARLLDEAGWKQGAAGGLRRRDGKEFRFSLLIFQSNPVYQQIASLLVDGLGRLGIGVDVRALDFPALLDRLRRRDFEAAMSGWLLTSEDPTAFFHSDPSHGSSNYAGYSNSEMDRLVIQGRHEMDPEKRRGIYRRVQELEAADQPYTFLFFPVIRVALESRFRAVLASPVASPLKPYPGPLQWYVPAKLQKRQEPP